MVYDFLRKVQANGTRAAIWAELYVVPREREGRKAGSTAVIDSQAIKSADKGAAKRRAAPPADAVGCDAGRRVKGRKIHAPLGTLGLPLRLLVHFAAAVGSWARVPAS